MRHDAIVIGGSFAGLSAATYIARTGRSLRVIDAGAPRNRFAAHSHGFFAQDGAEPHAMIATARAQLAHYPNATFSDGKVVEACPVEQGFAVKTASGESFETARIVLAYGVKDELPGHRGLAERWGKSVLHCPYCHGYEVKNQRLGVLYAAEKSIHQALLIAEWGPTTLFLDGHAMPDAVTLDALAARKIEVEAAPVGALDGPGTSLSAIHLANGREVEIDALFIAAPTRPNSDLAEQLGCAVDAGSFGPVIRAGEDRMTTVPGVYAAGDAARAPHSIGWAVGDGVTAGVSLHQSLVFPPSPAA